MADSSKFRFVSPGIFLNEIDQSQVTPLPNPVGPVLIGRFERGPAMVPVKVETFSDFVQVFGNPIPGGNNKDVWRNGNYSAPTYAAYAAQAWLRSNSPVTVIRLAGFSDPATDSTSPAVGLEAAGAGWGTNLNDLSNTNSEGAIGLWAVVSGSGNDTRAETCTASLAAVFYVKDGSTTTLAISGTLMNPGASSHATASHYAAIGTSSANSNGQFVMMVGDRAAIAAGTADRIEFNFDPASEKYIRNVFNTNPQRTNNDITPAASREDYWLGETFERHIQDSGRTSISSLNDITHGFMTHLSNGTINWADHGRDAEPARTNWFISQDTGEAANCNYHRLTKLFRLVGLDASGDWLQKHLKVSIQDIKPPTSNAPGVPQYGTFTVALRKIEDQDTQPAFAELFTNCTLDPDSPNYLPRKIGDKYMLWDAEKKKFRHYGSYANNSKFIRVELHPDVENGGAEGLLPFGFIGHPVVADSEIKTKSTSATAVINCVAEASLNDTKDFILTDTAGTATRYNISTGLATSGNGDAYTPGGSDSKGPAGTITIGMLGTTSAADVATQIAARINAGTNIGFSAEVTDSTNVTVTQSVAGADGNKTNTQPDGATGLTVGNFSGGSDLDMGQHQPVRENGEGHLVVCDKDGVKVPAGFIMKAREKSLGTDLTTLLRWPRVPLVAATDQPGRSYAKPNQVYFGMDTTISGSSKYDASIPAALRALPDAGVLSQVYTVGANDETAGYVSSSCIFTLDDIVVPGIHSGDTTIARYNSGSRKNATTGAGARASVTALSGTNFLLTASSMGYNRFTTVFHGGFDGLDVTEADPFRNSLLSGKTSTTSYAFNSVKRAMNMIRDPEFVEMNLASMPGLTNTVLTEHLINICEERADALAIIDLEGDYIPAADSNVAENAAGRKPNADTAAYNLKNRRLNSSYGAAYFPYVTIRDTLNDKILNVPPSVLAMGAISYSENARDLWFAPAGFTRGGLSDGKAGLTVLGTKLHLTSDDRDTLYAANINPIATFPAEGVVIFGQKTLQVTPSALDRINVRRLMIHIKREVSRIAATTLFEQNVMQTWNNFKADVDTFLGNIKTGLGLTDYKVVLDDTTTTPDLVDRNIMYAKIFLKPAQAIEFIALDFVITDSGASFDD